MSVSIDDIKKLREATGASMMACKKALEESNGDYEKAFDELRKKGVAKAGEKSTRTTGEGVIYSYIHTNKKVGAMIQLACETDFVARNEKFVELAADLAMHIVAANPMTVSPEEISDEFIAKEKEIWKAQLENEGKPADKIEMILENKAKKAREEFSLMKQQFVKDPEKTVEQLILESINKMGENIKIVRFVRYQI
ncbi:translation elongation factor Ts [Candidatus Peregrinibacteria bacterium]|nr:translation elongation factor Ts [Candidatus Peregrinibacteria bacterium]